MSDFDLKYFFTALTSFLVFFALLYGNGDESKKNASPFPLQFSIPACKVIRQIPKKDQDFAYLIPGQLETYIYDSESAYYQDYQRSYFGVTCKKLGWDCMRHYEILANGCIPYFLDLDSCDLQTMHFLPRDLIKEAMNLEGVSLLKIDHEKFDKSKYFKILKKLLEYTYKHLTTESMAKYFLETIKYSGDGKILFLSQDSGPDYLRCCTLIGLKEILKDRIIDYPKIEHIYQTYQGNILELYGKGMSYTKIVEDFPVNREDIAQRILKKEFDIIIYGSVERGLPFHQLVQELYEGDEIVYICGEDQPCDNSDKLMFFLREFEKITLISPH